MLKLLTTPVRSAFSGVSAAPATLCLALTLVLLSPSTAPVAAEEGIREKATEEQEEVARQVIRLVEYLHLYGSRVDDSASERCFDVFLEQLDYYKEYFLESDVAEFRKSYQKLDDQLRKGDLSFAFDVYRRYLQRAEETYTYVQEVLDGKLDFTKDEYYTIKPELCHFSPSVDDSRDRWRRKVKLDLLGQLTSYEDSTDEETKALTEEERLAKAKEMILKRYKNRTRFFKQRDNYELIEIFISSLTRGLDPHSTYMSPRELENFQIRMSLELEGIGAALREEDGFTIVTQVIPGGAADRDGRIQVNDKIVGVAATEKDEVKDVVGMKLSDVVDLIRGPKDTIVKLEVMPDGSAGTKVYEFKRAKVVLEDGQALGEVIDHGKKADGTPYKIGVIELPSFYRDMKSADDGESEFRSTTRDVEKLLEGFKSQSVDAVVLDLRMNGGGYLREAVELTGLFIDRGPVVQVRGYDNRIQVHKDLETGVAWGGPLMVLTTKASASASEILAGAIKDYRRGLIVGDNQTYGKGSVQQLVPVGREGQQFGALKVTTQLYYRPSGASTQNRGVVADITLPSITNHTDSEKDLDYSLPFSTVKPAEVTDYGAVSTPLVAKLLKLSEERRKASPEYQELQSDIERYKLIKERARVPLNRVAYRADIDRLTDPDDEDEEEEGAEGLVEDANRKTILKDFRLMEALAIACDYVEHGPWDNVP